METLYEYLLDNYKENEPIFLADLQVDGMTRTNVRQQIKKLTDTGKVKRFDGIAVFIKDGNEVKFIMLVFQVINNSTIVSVFYCEVF